MFAPRESFALSTPFFDRVRENKFNLIDSHILKASLKGYVFSEIKLATGQRSGQLGGKRKLAVETYGFSFKNFVQIFRLIEVGKRFFDKGEYMVAVKDYNPELHKFLMEIKTQPQNFTCEQLSELVEEKYKELEGSIEKSTINFKFDVDIAASLVEDARIIYG